MSQMRCDIVKAHHSPRYFSATVTLYTPSSNKDAHPIPTTPMAIYSAVKSGIPQASIAPEVSSGDAYCNRLKAPDSDTHKNTSEPLSRFPVAAARSFAG